MTSIEATIADEVFTHAPTYQRVVVTATVSDPRQTVAGVDRVLTDALADAAERFADTTVTDVPTISAWRTAFKAAGINPSKFRPAVEALLRRAIRGDDLRLGNTFIDIGTAVSLTTLCPVGMHTVDNLSGPLQLREALGTEKFPTFDGAVEQPDPGEIVYVAGDIVLTRRWVWRQGAVGSIMPGISCRLAINIDLLEGVDGTKALELVKTLVTESGADAIAHHTLSREAPTAVLTW